MGGRLLVSPVAVGLIGSFVAGYSSTATASIVRWALIAGAVVALVLSLLAQRAGRDRPGFPARSLLVTATALGLVMATAASAVADNARLKDISSLRFSSCGNRCHPTRRYEADFGWLCADDVRPLCNRLPD